MRRSVVILALLVGCGDDGPTSGLVVGNYKVTSVLAQDTGAGLDDQGATFILEKSVDGVEVTSTNQVLVAVPSDLPLVGTVYRSDMASAALVLCEGGGTGHCGYVHQSVVLTSPKPGSVEIELCELRSGSGCFQPPPSCGSGGGAEPGEAVCAIPETIEATWFRPTD